MQMDKRERINGFVRELWLWYALHKRSLPWRDLQDVEPNQRAYSVAVSEFMLQQTQVSRVVPAFRSFLGRFPTIESLARAQNADVIRAWQGMGYNMRSLRLRDVARVVVEEHGGRFPQEMRDLLAMKGIGAYTAAAIRNFAFDLPTPCLDTNIRRILHRTFVGPERADGTWKQHDRYLLQLAAEVLDAALKIKISNFEMRICTAQWHAALMDFGSLVCTKHAPRWDVCPLTAQGLCRASYKVPQRRARIRRTEPGRLVGSQFIPNRIFRGRVVEELRGAPGGLTLEEIGNRICIDWQQEDHRIWLQDILHGLVRDALLRERRSQSVYTLS